MAVDQLHAVLLWTGAAHYALLVVAFVAWRIGGDAVYRLHARWFTLDRAQYHALAYLVFALWKLGIWLLFLVPGLVLWWLQRNA